MKILNRNIIVETITVLFIILFLYSGLSKLLNYEVFKEQIATSHLLAPFAHLISYGVPCSEFVAILLLIFPRWRLKGLYFSLGIMLLFIIYIIGILIFNKNMPCSCGGVLEQLSWKNHIIFNSLFIALAITGIRIERQAKNQKKTELLTSL